MDAPPPAADGEDPSRARPVEVPIPSVVARSGRQLFDAEAFDRPDFDAGGFILSLKAHESAINADELKEQLQQHMDGLKTRMCVGGGPPRRAPRRSLPSPPSSSSPPPPRVSRGPNRAARARARARGRFELINDDFAQFTALAGELRGVDARASELRAPMGAVDAQVAGLQALTRGRRDALEAQCARYHAVRARRRELERCARFAETLEEAERLLRAGAGRADARAALAVARDGATAQIVGQYAYAARLQLLLVNEYADGASFVWLCASRDEIPSEIRVEQTAARLALYARPRYRLRAACELLLLVALARHVLAGRAALTVAAFQLRGADGRRLGRARAGREQRAHDAAPPVEDAAALGREPA